MFWSSSLITRKLIMLLQSISCMPLNLHLRIRQALFIRFRMNSRRFIEPFMTATFWAVVKGSIVHSKSFKLNILHSVRWYCGFWMRVPTNGGACSSNILASKNSLYVIVEGRNTILLKKRWLIVSMQVIRAEEQIRAMNFYVTYPRTSNIEGVNDHPKLISIKAFLKQ